MLSEKEIKAMDNAELAYLIEVLEDEVEYRSELSKKELMEYLEKNIEEL